MKISRTQHYAALSVSALALWAAAASPAYAQDAAGDASDTAKKDDAKAGDGSQADIVVTGSLIRRDQFTAAEPLTVITAEEITQAGFNSAADALQSTQVTQGSAQINNYFAGYVTNGGTGANTLSLRGLGPARTLLLLNGHRLAPAGTRGSVGSADTNVLPTALIERIEILKAGASSIYGSDAVAGVVNIITDTKLKGIVLEGQVNAPGVGAGVSRRLSASFGYSGDRLRLIGSLEYYKRDRLSRNDVSWTKCPIGGYLTGQGTARGSGDYIDPVTGQPACFTLDNGGVTINTLGVPTRNAQDRYTNVIGRYNRLIPDATVVGGPTPGYKGVTYYTRDTFDPRQEEEDLITPAETYTGYFQAGYDLQMLGNAEAYVELLGNKRKSSSLLYRQLTLDYAQGSLLVEPQFRNGIFLNPNQISNGNYVAARAFIGFGNTKTSQSVDFVRAAGGIRGDLPFKDWRYDLYFSKSWSDAAYDTESFLTDRIARSLNVVQNSDGSFRCADLSDANCVAAPALNADTIAGNLPEAYKNYILQNVRGTTKYREFVTSFNVNGPIFSLPGGDAQLAIGLEYRDASIDDTPPLDSINGNLYGLTSAVITRGSDSVKEAFGEIFLPILSDVPFFYRLNLDGSARYTDYKSYGSEWTYKISGEWEPFKGIGFRGSYGTSYRAPALFEQFLGATSGFLGSSTDPCDDYANSSNPTIRANCAAIGLPANFVQTSSVTVLTAGGRDTGLKAETSKNLSVGLVIQPPLPVSLGSFSFAVDYFDIEVDNGVSRAGASAILNLCYGDLSFNPNEGYCRLVTRDANNAVTVRDNYINLSTDKVRGLEFNARYSTRVGPGKFTINGLVTKYLEQSSRLFPTDPIQDANGTISQPDWTGSFNATYNVGKFTLRYGLDWVTGDHEKTYAYFAFDSSTGQVDTAYEQYLKDNYYFEVNDYFLHSISGQVDIDRFEITFGVRNLFDTKPPEISSGGYNLVGNAPLYSGYDYTGRTFFLNTTIKF